ncbi:hypothetical protein TSUD_170160 [Trifolium subterraneum]|uniref:SPX domain-containing protein n=1 Tax=Trifolium subterraneum TaxID=3900 RepID=A0A2Z6LTE1_TRISU|nr:hypothetical protein TSUD_170160 [Trifolium subterraneum]
MKFGKEFVSQMVPEWQQAYMNYISLKSILKHMSKFKEQNESNAPKGSLRKILTHCRAFSGLNGSKQRDSSSSESEDGEGDSKESYKTMFLKPYEDGAEKDLVFFRKLDFEFNKVNAFYKKMVKEVVDEAEELSKQMNFLIAFRIKVDKVGFGNVDSSNIGSSSSIMHHADDGHSHSPHVDVIPEIEMSNESHFNDGDGNNAAQTNPHMDVIPEVEMSSESNLEILNRVKINVTTPENPSLRKQMGNLAQP